MLCRGQVRNNKIKQIPTLSLAFQPLKMYPVKAPLTSGNVTSNEPYVGNLCATSDEILYAKVLQKTLNKMLSFLFFFFPFMRIVDSWLYQNSGIFHAGFQVPLL